ncbi:putative membrane protein YteJ [Sporosarcina sp. NCCP-2716]|uniref:RDD family protein n=1 Tax=Sporosarcina sp. NCCP-2716 TaxID=2943679 RepID=UPI00203FA0A1|nr:RDD family protein [Sporosarcina sp. NCCP-2716]GKV69565.1 putative membrane protein YteJ [Sporosarcina sp. NCCP-2716]
MSDELETSVVSGQPPAESVSLRSAEPDAREPGFRHKPAGFWIRFWAYIIDLIVIGAISGLIVKPVFRIFGWPITDPFFLLYSPYKAVLLVIFLAYFLLMTKFFGQTAGKMICGIRVVRKSGGPLGWVSLLFREVIGRYISKTLVVPYLLVVFMPRNEALHDLFADTEVIHERLYEAIPLQDRPAVAGRHQLPEGQSI